MRVHSKLYNQIFILTNFILFVLITQVFCGFEFTNLKCNALDKSFCKYDYCYLKSINRTYKYASVKLSIYQLPITNMTIQFDLMKRLNGYKPFLYNITFNYCNYMKSSNPGYKVIAYLHHVFVDFSNINHTCPFNHDFILDKLPIDHVNIKVTKVLPVPEGDYRITAKMVVNKGARANFMVYFKIY